MYFLNAVSSYVFYTALPFFFSQIALRNLPYRKILIPLSFNNSYFDLVNFNQFFLLVQIFYLCNLVLSWNKYYYNTTYKLIICFDFLHMKKWKNFA